MFYLWVKQEYEGCAGSIGCGSKLLELASSTAAGARKEAINLILNEEDGYLDLDSRLSAALVLESSSVILVGNLYAEYDDKQLRDEKARKEQEERREYERLQAKFG